MSATRTAYATCPLCEATCGLEFEIGEGERPAEIPATEIVILHDPESDRALAILFFDSDDDYRRGDAALDAMPAGDTPGKRTSVTRYEVAIRRT